MRISQLARELNVSPTKIVKYLEELGMEAEKGVSTKLMDAGVQKVVEKFGTPDSILSATVDDISPDKSAKDHIDEISENTVEKSIDEIDELIPEENKEDSLDSPEAEAEPLPEPEPVEVIKPQLVKLQGLKVVGKIELAEEKEKESEKENENENENESESESESESRIGKKKLERRKPRRYEGRRERPKKRVLSYEEKLKREEKLREREREEQEHRRKEKKRKAYEQKVRKLKAEKRQQVKKTRKEQVQTSKKEESPKSTWGKIVDWFNG